MMLRVFGGDALPGLPDGARHVRDGPMGLIRTVVWLADAQGHKDKAVAMAVACQRFGRAWQSGQGTAA